MCRSYEASRKDDHQYCNHFAPTELPLNWVFFLQTYRSYGALLNFSQTIDI